MKRFLLTAMLLVTLGALNAAESTKSGFLPANPSEPKSNQPRVIWLEAERFSQAGGWSTDTQFVDTMGSVQLLATGCGKPVDDAATRAAVQASGAYRLWVRCRDWLPEHSPGLFRVLVNGKASATTFGKAKDDKWQWIDGGMFELQAGTVDVRLHDLTGWWGRCDAVVLAQENFKPSNNLQELGRQRLRYSGISAKPERMDDFDLVVVGGGPAGMGASIAAARLGLKVALIQDRPVVGGNASSEIKIPPMGYIGSPPDRINVTGITEELFGAQGGAADQSRMDRVVQAEKNLRLFLNTRATGVEMKDKETIDAVLAVHVKTGQRYRFKAPLFVDCTGHAWIGYYAGAEYMMGQEARSQFNESMAPETARMLTQGNSLNNASFRTHQQPVDFNCPPWAYQWTKASDFEELGSHTRLKSPVRPPNFDVPSRGKGRHPGNHGNGAAAGVWWVEYGGIANTIDDAERIRDELFRVCLGLWNYAKNHNPETREQNRSREMVWLNYVPGVRESRRLVGDYVMTQHNFDDPTPTADAIAFSDWGIDLHHPEGFWVRGIDAIHVYHGRRTCIPYRTLYSKNIRNLFMAGRCHSATQLAFAGTRVMRPMCATGQAAGTAAAIASKYKSSPRGVYEKHLAELQQQLLKDGCYIPGVQGNDSLDLARKSTVTASSFVEGGEPANAVNGWNRVVGKNRNAWSPSPSQRPPHWLRLSFTESSPIGEVHLTFEKESVECKLEIHHNGAWQEIAAVPAQQTRRHVLKVKTAPADAIRLVTERDVSLGICEIRVYRQ
ncbi:MAG: FAD-dependent oxidoreductase [Verrucomicrobia bacterium]|nr:FAD-dependent oxidoreductase [Verrucomicrobiota bacterium]